MKFDEIPEPVPLVAGVVIGYETGKLWSEFQLLLRVIYRSRNQHRAAWSFHRLQEVKRTAERVARVELWLKANNKETFEFIGYLNTLRKLVEKTREAAMKAFYYYMQYLDQLLFVQTALVIVGSLATIYKELGQWLKYIHLLHNSKAPKVLAVKGMDLLFKEHGIPLKLQEISDSKPLQSPKSPSTGPRKHPNNSSQKPQKKMKTSEKPRKDGDEIDAIFDIF